MKEKLKKYIGDKAFYKTALAIIVPVVIQQLILSIAGYTDTLMINSYSDVAYNGVATANRFMFLMNFFWIGLATGISIFISQYFGAKDEERITGTIQLSIIVGVVLGIASMFLIHFLGPIVLKLFISGSELKDIKAVEFGTSYLKIIAIGGVIMLLNYMTSTIYRVLGKPKIPMYAGIIAILVNIVLNFILIFGLLGFAPLGARGAAIATVISKVVELGILIIVALVYDKNKYIYKVFNSYKVDMPLFKAYLTKGLPVLFNEVLWATGVQLLVMLITAGNYDWLQSLNYAQNITDLFFIYFAGLATGTAILVGSALGENEFDKAKDYSKKLIGLAIMASLVAVILMIVISPLLLLILTEPNGIYYLTSYYLILVTAAFITFHGFNSSIYFILRAGGDTLKAFFLDQGPTYLIGIPIALLFYLMNGKWQVGIVLIFASTKIVDLIKIYFAVHFYKRETWVQNITLLTKTQELKTA